MAKITFAGTMLFCVEGGKLKEVRFPNSAAIPRGGRAESGKRYHVDDSIARLHYPLLLHSKDSGITPTVLQGSRLSFQDATDFPDANHLSSLVEVGALTPKQPLQLDPSASLACLVHMKMPRGVTVTTSSHEHYEFRVAACNTLYHSMVDMSWSGSVQLLVENSANGAATITIGEAETVMIGHFDRLIQYTEEVAKSDDVTFAGDERDVDFGWIYSLLSSSLAHTELWGRGAPFTVPWAKKLTVGNLPSVSTCLPARFGS